MNAARANPKNTCDYRPSASAIMRCGFPARAISTWRTSPSCRTRLSHLAPALRRAGEFQILDYKIPRSAQPGRGEGSFMLTDRYGLPLSTTSTAARDDYVLATDRALTFYPGAAEAYDRAIAADSGFALAHAGKAQVLMRQGDAAAAQAALAAAKDVSAGLPEREASHIGFFDLVFAGRTEAAIAALYPHLAAWPRDALVVSVAANPNGVIGGSGRIGQKRQIAEMMDNLASHYGDDFWFTSYHAMALSEDG